MLTIIILLSLLIFIAILVDRLRTQKKIIDTLHLKKEYDTHLARQVHQTVFAPIPSENNYLTIGNKISFSKELGGDYYYLADLGDKLFYCIADISGKSVASAIFSTHLHEAVMEAVETNINLADIVQTINGRMYTFLPEDMYITLFCAFVDRNEIKYINAGHEPPLLYAQEQKRVGYLLSTENSLPLGMEPFLELPEQEQYFSSGDILLAVTDGVTDSELFRDNPYRKLGMMLKQTAEASAEDIVDKIFRSVAHDHSQFPMDDIIITCIKRKERL